MAVGLGLVAARRRWRLAMLVIAASYFGVGIAGAAERAVPWAVMLYGVVGGTAGLYLGLRERWWETRLLTFSGGWWLLAAANDRIASHWATLGAGRHARGAGLVARTPLAARAADPSPSARARSGTWRRGRRLVGGRSVLLLRHSAAARVGGSRRRTRPVRRNGGARRPGRGDSLPARGLSPTAPTVRRGRSGRARRGRLTTLERSAAGIRSSSPSRWSGPRSIIGSTESTAAGTAC